MVVLGFLICYVLILRYILISYCLEKIKEEICNQNIIDNMIVMDSRYFYSKLLNYFLLPLLILKF
jgi:hypothetical protein